MSTTAIITMILVQGSVTALTVYIYYKVMSTPMDSQESSKKEESK